MDKNVGSTVLLSVHPMRGMTEGGLLAAVKHMEGFCFSSQWLRIAKL